MTEVELAAAAAWLNINVGLQGPVVAEKFLGGQSNPTYLMKGRDRSVVLRRKPPGVLLKSAHAVEREYRVQRALESSEVPVAKMLALCEDESVIGSVFYAMDYVPGRCIDESERQR